MIKNILNFFRSFNLFIFNLKKKNSLLISHVTFSPAHIKQAADPLSFNAFAVKDQLNRFWCLQLSTRLLFTSIGTSSSGLKEKEKKNVEI